MNHKTTLNKECIVLNDFIKISANKFVKSILNSFDISFVKSFIVKKFHKVFGGKNLSINNPSFCL